MGIPFPAAPAAGKGEPEVAAQAEGEPTKVEPAVFKPEHFEVLDYREAGLDAAGFAAFRTALLGRAVPPQTSGNEELVRAVFDSRFPWEHATLETYLLNH